MHIHLHHHFNAKEAYYIMANAALEAQLKRANDYIAELKQEVATAQAATATAADAADNSAADELSTSLDAAGAPPAA